MSFFIIYFLYSYMDCESAINIYIYNTPPWALAGTCPPLEIQKYRGPPKDNLTRKFYFFKLEIKRRN